MPRYRRFIALGIVMAIGLTACGGGGSEASSPLGVAVDSLELTESGAAGLAVYEAKCAVCHRSDLLGATGKALGPLSAAADKPAEELRRIITDGASGMPSWGGVLSEQEIADVVAFLLEAQGR
ncbi:MAG: cytochrome c [Acidimicrobiia bacterium]|nr:cytochrome c [Acidimicrobiia bacterium]